jgi:hypothetical protein
MLLSGIWHTLRYLLLSLYILQDTISFPHISSLSVSLYQRSILCPQNGIPTTQKHSYGVLD